MGHALINCLILQDVLDFGAWGMKDPAVEKSKRSCNLNNSPNTGPKGIFLDQPLKYEGNDI